MLGKKHWTEELSSYGRFRGRTEGTEGADNLIGKSTITTHLGPWELPETKSTTKEHTWAASRPPAICTKGLAALSAFTGRGCT